MAVLIAMAIYKVYIPSMPTLSNNLAVPKRECKQGIWRESWITQIKFLYNFNWVFSEMRFCENRLDMVWMWKEVIPTIKKTFKFKIT